MDELIKKYKEIYHYYSWGKTSDTDESLSRPYSLCLRQGDGYKRISQNITARMWGNAMYTQVEELEKDGVTFRIITSPYYSDKDSKDALLLKMSSAVTFQKEEDARIGEFCYTNPSMPKSYLLIMSHHTIVEISVPKGGDHLARIKDLAAYIVGQMKNLPKK